MDICAETTIQCMYKGSTGYKAICFWVVAMHKHALCNGETSVACMYKYEEHLEYFDDDDKKHIR